MLGHPPPVLRLALCPRFSDQRTESRKDPMDIDRRGADRIRLCRIEYRNDNCEKMWVYFGKAGGMSGIQYFSVRYRYWEGLRAWTAESLVWLMCASAAHDWQYSNKKCRNFVKTHRHLIWYLPVSDGKCTFFCFRLHAVNPRQALAACRRSPLTSC